MGYAGGKKLKPTYRDLGDHTETVQVDYDPGQVSYEDLLRVFWQSHDPTEPIHSRQYASIIFADGEWEQTSEAWRTPELLAWLYNESAVRDTVVVDGAERLVDGQPVVVK